MIADARRGTLPAELSDGDRTHLPRHLIEETLGPIDDAIEYEPGAQGETMEEDSGPGVDASDRSAACFGASPVAAAWGFKSRRDPALHSNHSASAPPADRTEPHISTWQRIGHFYLALTD